MRDGGAGEAFETSSLALPFVFVVRFVVGAASTFALDLGAGFTGDLGAGSNLRRVRLLRGSVGSGSGLPFAL